MNETAPPRAATAAPLDLSSIRRIVIGVMLAMLLAAIDQTIVATALPTIGNELKDLEHLPWVVTAYLLSGTAVTPFYGKLADIVGRRAVLLVGISIFIVGSILCALAPSMWFLIGARFIQGLGGGGLIALGQTIVADVVSPKERMRYQAYFASVFATSSIAGPILGGFFAERLHWSFIFWINIPLGLLALAMTNSVLKRLPRHERPHRLDIVGAVLMVAATVALLLALSWGGGVYAWGSPQILGLLALSLVAWILFVVRLLRAAEPFVPLAVMFNPVVAAGTASNFFVVGTMVALTIYMPIYFETVIGLTASQSGLALIAFAGGTVAGAQLAGRIMVWTPRYKRGPLVGLVVGIAATILLALTATHLTLLTVELLLLVAGLGIGTIFPVTTVSVQNAVEPHQLGTATASFNFFRSLGSAIFVAIFGAIFLGGLGLGGTAIGSLDQLVAQAAANGTAVAPVFQYVFGTAAAVLVVGFLCFLAMKELPLRGR
ncbi:MAG TPA: MDR family MFS transporter [Bauldia sp.]|nr:MDR family MFS transporter [Bauldia sp.]